MSHPTGPVVSISSNTTLEVVDDYLVAPQDDPTRPAVYASGDFYTFLATSRETDFAFNFFDFFLPVGGGPPAHYHPYEHETWFVNAGEIQFNLGNQGTNSLVVPEGTLVFGPRIRTHGYNNIDSTASISGVTPGARTLSMTTPGALDLFFDAVATRVIDNNEPIPFATVPTDQEFINLGVFAQRTGGGIAFPTADYQPPAGTLDYVMVLPKDAEADVVEGALALAELDNFNVWTTGEQAGLPQRPTFTGAFGIEYTSLLTLEETRNESSYNQFSLAPQSTHTFVQANLNSNQVLGDTESLATGVARVEINGEGDDIDYSLTVTGLDFGELVECGTPQTPDNELDDVTGLHIHSGERGSTGPHAFSIFDPKHQDENDLSITINSDGSTTISGTWNQSEMEIPTALSDFIYHSHLPGQESDFYFQVHTEGNPKGEIRGQIARTTDDFPEPVESVNHELFYVNEGQLSIKIGDEVRLAGPDTFVYVAPGNKYSIGNFAEQTVESLAITAIDPETEQVTVDTTGYNLVYGSEGNDLLLAGSKEQLIGGEGDDTLEIVTGGDNLLYGGSGADQFWIVNGRLPDTVPETRQLTVLPSPLPPIPVPSLEDTRNIIMDFELGIDQIQIRGISNISSFGDLTLLPAFGDIRSTSILATVDGTNAQISLANVSGIQFNQFSASDFVFA